MNVRLFVCPILSLMLSSVASGQQGVQGEGGCDVMEQEWKINILLYSNDSFSRLAWS